MATKEASSISTAATTRRRGSTERTPTGDVVATAAHRSAPYGDVVTREERFAILSRIAADAGDRLVVGPAVAIAYGGLAVFALGAAEARLWLRQEAPFAAKLYFTVRYAASQLLPSFVWGTQSAQLVAQVCHKEKRQIVICRREQLSALTQIRLHNLAAVRGAFAGAVLLSQVFALTEVAQNATRQYERRCRNGQESPLLESSAVLDTPGVVVRLCGAESDTTSLTLARRGRRRIFPVFEDPSLPSVRQIFLDHGTTGVEPNALESRLVADHEHENEDDDDENDEDANDKHRVQTRKTSKNDDDEEEEEWSWFRRFMRLLFPFAFNPLRLTVPVMWKVDNQRYGNASSWSQLGPLPEQWLFRRDAFGKPPLLILEADATVATSASLGPKCATTLDLDLDEAAQGFYRLSNLLPPHLLVHSGASRLSRQSHKIVGASATYIPHDDIPETSNGGGGGGAKILSSSTVEPKPRNTAMPTPMMTPSVQVLRVLLVDADSVVVGGGGRKSRIAERVAELGMADVVINARRHVLDALLQWLKRASHNDDSSPRDPATGKIIVALETPSRISFVSIRAALEQTGLYLVKERSSEEEVLTNTPVIVYGSTSANTVHTVRHLVEQHVVSSHKVCALLDTHEGMEELQSCFGASGHKRSSSSPYSHEFGGNVGCICASDLYDRAFNWVREAALERGLEAKEIQLELNQGKAFGRGKTRLACD